MRTAALGTLGGLLAGALAAMLHTFLAAWLFPAVITEVVIPSGDANRLAWLSLGSGLVGLVAAASARSPAGVPGEAPLLQSAP
jgi:hypothetical protein